MLSDVSAVSPAAANQGIICNAHSGPPVKHTHIPELYRNGRGKQNRDSALGSLQFTAQDILGPGSSVCGLAPLEKSELGPRLTPGLFRLTLLDRGSLQHRTVAGFDTVLMRELSCRVHTLVFQPFQLLRVLTTNFDRMHQLSVDGNLRIDPESTSQWILHPWPSHAPACPSRSSSFAPAVLLARKRTPIPSPPR